LHQSAAAPLDPREYDFASLRLTLRLEWGGFSPVQRAGCGARLRYASVQHCAFQDAIDSCSLRRRHEQPSIRGIEHREADQAHRARSVNLIGADSDWLILSFEFSGSFPARRYQFRVFAFFRLVWNGDERLMKKPKRLQAEAANFLDRNRVARRGS
jgi:hypothetical protein